MFIEHKHFKDKVRYVFLALLESVNVLLDSYLKSFDYRALGIPVQNSISYTNDRELTTKYSLHPPRTHARKHTHTHTERERDTHTHT